MYIAPTLPKDGGSDNFKKKCVSTWLVRRLRLNDAGTCLLSSLVPCSQSSIHWTMLLPFSIHFVQRLMRTVAKLFLELSLPSVMKCSLKVDVFTTDGKCQVLAI